MVKEWGEHAPNRLRELRLLKGLKLEQVGEGVGLSAMQVSRLERGTRPLSLDAVFQFAEFFGCRAVEILSESPVVATAPLVGYVGAGAMYYPDPEHGAWQEIEQVEAPPSGRPGVVAVRVRGDALYPVYQEGDLLYFRREPQVPIERCLGKDCIVQIGDGSTHVRRVEEEPEGYRLEAYSRPPIRTIKIVWAAPILWVRRNADDL